MSIPLNQEPISDRELAKQLCLVHIALVDQYLDESERRALRKEVFTRHHPVEEAALLRATLEAAPLSPQELATRIPDPEDRADVLQSAYRIAYADGVLSEPERIALQGLCRAFGFDASHEQALAAEAAHRAGLELSKRERFSYDLLQQLREVGAEVSVVGEEDPLSE
jgi:uncharacterized tellurite resistance protein B-like protein